MRPPTTYIEANRVSRAHISLSPVQVQTIRSIVNRTNCDTSANRPTLYSLLRRSRSVHEMKGFVTGWGSTAQERSLVYPCDPLLPAPTMTLYRAVSIEAPADVTFRWLCQLRAAPYSYDRVDNRGRRSPQQLTPGLERLEIGQRFAGAFELVAFELGRSLTLWHRSRLFGRVAITYAVEREDAEASRIVLKILSDAPAPMRWLLAPGDLFMARRQLLNLKALAERG